MNMNSHTTRINRDTLALLFGIISINSYMGISTHELYALWEGHEHLNHMFFHRNASYMDILVFHHQIDIRSISFSIGPWTSAAQFQRDIIGTIT